MESHPHVFGQITLSREQYEANVAKAVAEEREACADLSERVGDQGGGGLGHVIAEAIRARGK